MEHALPASVTANPQSALGVKSELKVFVKQLRELCLSSSDEQTFTALLEERVDTFCVVNRAAIPLAGKSLADIWVQSCGGECAVGSSDDRVRMRLEGCPPLPTDIAERQASFVEMNRWRDASLGQSEIGPHIDDTSMAQMPMYGTLSLTRKRLLRLGVVQNILTSQPSDQSFAHQQALQPLVEIFDRVNARAMLDAPLASDTNDVVEAAWIQAWTAIEQFPNDLKTRFKSECIFLENEMRAFIGPGGPQLSRDRESHNWTKVEIWAVCKCIVATPFLEPLSIQLANDIFDCLNEEKRLVLLIASKSRRQSSIVAEQRELERLKTKMMLAFTRFDGCGIEQVAQLLTQEPCKPGSVVGAELPRELIRELQLSLEPARAIIQDDSDPRLQNAIALQNTLAKMDCEARCDGAAVGQFSSIEAAYIAHHSDELIALREQITRSCAELQLLMRKAAEQAKKTAAKSKKAAKLSKNRSESHLAQADSKPAGEVDAAALLKSVAKWVAVEGVSLWSRLSENELQEFLENHLDRGNFATLAASAQYHVSKHAPAGTTVEAYLQRAHDVATGGEFLGEVVPYYGTGTYRRARKIKNLWSYCVFVCDPLTGAARVLSYEDKLHRPYH